MTDGVVDAILQISDHDGNRAAMTESLNPFRPGAGRLPAYRGRRPEIEGTLSRFLQTLRSGRPDTELGFLYGPRGNGKTVLLRWLRQEAAREGGPDEKKIVLARVSPTDIASSTSVAQTILNAVSGFGSPGEWTLEAGFNLGLGMIRATRKGKPRALSLAEILSEETDPLLLTLDEAHEASPEILGGLLNIVQEAGEVRPIAAVFAGTPGLEAALRRAHASFWNRGKQLPVGLLEEESAREVLARPFRDAGLEADDEAVAKLAAAADYYPYFLQLYGEVAWDVMEESGSRIFLPEHVAPVLKAADGHRQVYYRNRLDEFFEAEWLPLARSVAEAFIKSAPSPADRFLSDAALRKILADHGNAVEARKFLVATGYVWREALDSSSWMPGIPSLMDFMIEEIPAL